MIRFARIALGLSAVAGAFACSSTPDEIDGSNEALRRGRHWLHADAGAGEKDAGGSTSRPDAGAPRADSGVSNSDSGVSSSDAGTTAPMGCAPAPSSNLVVSVKDKGATGDGHTNDTAAIQAAVDQVKGSGGTVLVPAGTYMIDALASVNLGSQMTFRMDKGATLKALPNGEDGYNVLFVNGQNHVNIVGGTLIGERADHTATTGEWGMGINVSSSDSVVIDGVVSNEMWGDGFFISWGASNVTVCSVFADHNRRQGLSVSGGSNILIKDSTFQNTIGTWPQSGIDIEPDQGLNATNITVTNSKFLGNYGTGILVFGQGAPTTGITLSGNTVANNSVGGGINLVTVSNSTVSGNTISDPNFGVQLTDGCTNDTVKNNDITGPGVVNKDPGNGNVVTGNTVH